MPRPVSPRPFPVQVILTKLRVNQRQLDRRLGNPSGRTCHQIRRGGLTLDLAERWADQLGYHPFEIWDNYFAEADRPPLCWRGVHVLEGDNVRVGPQGRGCWACHRDRTRERNEQRRAELGPVIRTRDELGRFAQRVDA